MTVRSDLQSRRDARLARARAVIPNGVSSGGRARFEDAIVRAKGAYVWNEDGKRFLDHLLAYGPIVLGHCDERVNEAVMRAVSTCDLTWVGTQPGEVELAEAICAVMPSAERVAFVRRGLTRAYMHATGARWHLLQHAGPAPAWREGPASAWLMTTAS
jgi:glutamate-1-semialdehyde 2,1-aminomutase